MFLDAKLGVTEAIAKFLRLYFFQSTPSKCLIFSVLKNEILAIFHGVDNQRVMELALIEYGKNYNTQIFSGIYEWRI